MKIEGLLKVLKYGLCFKSQIVYSILFMKNFAVLLASGADLFVNCCRPLLIQRIQFNVVKEMRWFSTGILCPHGMVVLHIIDHSGFDRTMGPNLLLFGNVQILFIFTWNTFLSTHRNIGLLLLNHLLISGFRVLILTLQASILF